jgi:hypothetical protein
MVPHAAIASTLAPAAEQSRTKRLLADLKQMSRASQREEGLLNHVQAGLILDVSGRRVGELVELGRLSRFDFLGRTYVSVREVLARREADVKAGRPPRTFRQRLAITAKTVAQLDVAQYVAEAFTREPKKQKKK